MSFQRNQEVLGPLGLPYQWDGCLIPTIPPAQLPHHAVQMLESITVWSSWWGILKTELTKAQPAGYNTVTGYLAHVQLTPRQQRWQ